MVTMGTKPTLLLVQLVVVAALVMATAQASVTIYNPAGLVVDILVDDKNVKVTPEMVTVDLTESQEDLHISVADGTVVDVNVHDGDVLVLIPDPADPLNVQAFKVQVGGDASLTPPKPSAAPIKPSATPKPPSLP